MLGLTKLISFGLTGLSTSGLSLYFVPKYFEDNSQPSQLIYKEGVSSSGIHVSSFEHNEDLLLKEMTELYENFKKATGYLETRKIEKYGDLQNTFRSVDKVENELQKLYEENRELFEKLSELAIKIFNKRQEKLTAEADIEKWKNYNTSMKKVGQVLQNWKNSIKKIICAIDQNAKNHNCGSGSNVSSQSSSISSGGGHCLFCSSN